MSTTNASIGVTAADRLKSAINPTNIIMVLGYAIFISLFITAFVRMSQFLGSKDQWNEIQPKILEVCLYTIFGTIAFAIATLIYMVQKPTYAVYFSIIVSCLAVGFSFAALAVASISR